MNQIPELPDKKQLLQLIFDSLHLTLLHYGLWFHETEHQIGLDKAIEADFQVWDQFLQTTLSRVTQTLNISLVGDIPEPLYNLTEKQLNDLSLEMCKNWVACDGIWFQTIEKNYDYEMFTTKRINDTNWVRFSRIEAGLIMKRLNLPPNGGLKALREALPHRQYSRICKFELEELPDSLILRINECRVQEARKKRGLPDYNCKSSGVAEYSYFAHAIDPRIKLRCLVCPPDKHPQEYWCAWEFTI